MFGKRASQTLRRHLILSSGVLLSSALLAKKSSSPSIVYADDIKPKNPKIVIVGGGTGGIGVAGMLKNDGYKDVTLVEPKDVHYYQPLWTLVGGGLKPVEESSRPMSSILPSDTKWIKSSVSSFDPENNTVILSNGTKVPYDYLVVAVGIVSSFEKIPGAVEALDDKDSGVVSVYDYNYAAKTAAVINKIKGGRAIFTVPTTPFKCPGAAQKIMWLLEEKARDKNFRNKVSLEYWIPGTAMFGIPKYSKILTEMADDRGIIRNFQKQLISINSDHKSAVFYDPLTKENITIEFTLLHVVPPMYPPPCLQGSHIANPAGYVEVDPATLQSTKYSNIFALGDCISAPNGKTAAAITSQGPVVVHNLEKAIKGELINGHYDGYTSCPLIISKSEVLLAEFGYNGKIMETFSSETGEFPYNLIGQDGPMQRKFFYWMKEQMFPLVYWNLWTRGRWFGNSGPFKPDVANKGKDFH